MPRHCKQVARQSRHLEGCSSEETITLQDAKREAEVVISCCKLFLPVQPLSPFLIRLVPRFARLFCQLTWDQCEEFDP